jgi:hypothetical protein
MEVVKDAIRNPATSLAGVGLLALSACNVVGLVAQSVILHKLPALSDIGQPVSIICGFAIAGVLGLLAKDPNNKFFAFIAAHLPAKTQAWLAQEATSVVSNIIIEGVKELENPKK